LISPISGFSQRAGGNCGASLVVALDQVRPAEEAAA